LLKISRGEFGQSPRDFDIELVGSHGEQRVSELTQLLLRCFESARVTVSEGDHADPRAEVEVFVAVNIGEDRPLTLLDVDRMRAAHRGGDVRRLSTREL